MNRKWFFMYMYLKDAQYPTEPYSEAELEERRKRAEAERAKADAAANSIESKLRWFRDPGQA